MRQQALREPYGELSPRDTAPLSPGARRLDHHWRFLRQWVRHPLRTASMLPSSRALARLMVSEIGPHTTPVVELGARTGAPNEATLKAGVAPNHLTAVELNPHFAELLQLEYPGIQVVAGSAEDLTRHVEAGSIGAVISSLPMVVLSPSEQRRIVTSAFEALRPGAHFYQFTYSHRCPISRRVLTGLELSTTCIGGTLRNWPPARVFRLTRSGEGNGSSRRRHRF
jgi:phosphatidylethanolamine/phosphatidyl-N-methylethanolamine N-methyltransferase